MKSFKNLTAIIALFLILSIPANAQLGFKPFKHFSVGVELGTTGVGFEVGTTLHSMVNLRGGFTFIPYTYSTDFDIDYDFSAVNELRESYSSELAQAGINLNNLNSTVDLDAKSGIYNGKILVDFHPIPTSGFHVTAGLYFGKDRIVTVEGGSETLKTLYDANILIQNNPGWGIQPFDAGIVIGDNTIEPDARGYIDAGIKINKVKPYVGIGFGRAVPKKRVGVQFDMGCMFHGKPTIISKNGDVTDLLNDELDSSGFVDIMNKITVYPVLSLRVTGRIL
ncbi:MAG: hypothetical protein LUH10_16510 [Tannerellaceae bacterium]|nr:hypothetical protein [Tannerellaceae bacterium]